VQAVIIPEGGHHLDLFFSNPKDPKSVEKAREVEMHNIKQWIKEFHHERKHAPCAWLEV
jgi:lysosomal Pro-X carboxypeptidase